MLPTRTPKVSGPDFPSEFQAHTSNYFLGISVWESNSETSKNYPSCAFENSFEFQRMPWLFSSKNNSVQDKKKSYKSS